MTVQQLSIFELPNTEFYAKNLICNRKRAPEGFHTAYQFNCAQNKIKLIQPNTYVPIESYFSSVNQNTYQTRPRKHHTNMLLWVRRAPVKYFCGKKTITVPTGGLIFVPKGAVYTCTGSLHNEDIMFTEFDLFSLDGEELQLGQEPVLLFEKCPEEIMQQFEALYNAFAGFEAKTTMFCNTVLYQLLLSIAAAKSSFPKDKIESSIFQCTAYLRRHYCEPIEIKKLCEVSLLSPALLRKSFKKYTGCTMVEFKNKLRVENAKLQLLNSNSSITKISAALGFENAFYFSKVFKKYTGVSPSEFKAAAKKKPL